MTDLPEKQAAATAKKKRVPKTPKISKETANKILAVVIAIALWVYVISEVNPTVTRTFANIPVQFSNMQSLTERELALQGDGQFFVDVTLEGKRTSLGNNDLRDKIVARADLLGYEKGEYRIEVSIDSIDGVTVKSISPQKIQVSIEELITETKDVQLKFAGTVPENVDITDIEITPSEIEISGASSTVKRVETIRVEVDYSKFKESGRAVTGTAVPLDVNGAVVENVQLSSETITINYSWLSIKEVNLIVEVTGQEAEGTTVDVSTPDKVLIIGKGSVLSDITSIRARSIDITGITANARIPLEFDLPEGVSLAPGNKATHAQLTVQSAMQVTFNYDREDIKISGLNEGLECVVNVEGVTLTAKGEKKDVEALAASNFTLSVNLEGMEAGTYSVPISVSTVNNIVTVADPASATVIIEESSEE